MRLRSFIAQSMNVAMERIRKDMGEDAIILSSNKEANGAVRVVAAIDNAKDDFQEVPHKLAAVPKFHSQIAEMFKFHNIPNDIARNLLTHLTDNHKKIESALEEIFSKAYKFSPLKFDIKKPLMVVGMPGIGKTLSLSKMATEATFYDRKINVISTDIKRAGGVEQLTAFTKILGIQLVICRNPEELKEEIEKKKDGITLIDTAGANPYDQAELNGTRDLLEVCHAEPILVIQAGGDVSEAIDIANAFKFTHATRMLITKADTARRMGSIFAVAENNKLAFSNFSGTPNVGKGLAPVTPKALAELILRPMK